MYNIVKVRSQCFNFHSSVVRLTRCCFSLGSIFLRMRSWCSWKRISFGKPGTKNPEDADKSGSSVVYSSPESHGAFDQINKCWFWRVRSQFVPGFFNHKFLSNKVMKPRCVVFALHIFYHSWKHFKSICSNIFLAC